MSTDTFCLQGFMSEFDYLGGRVLRVDRQDRVTLPQSNITVPGMGFPKLFPPPAPTQEQAAGAEDEVVEQDPQAEDIGLQREDLVILFDLSATPAAEEEEPQDKEEQFINLDEDGPTILSSQEEIDGFIKKQSASRDELLGRKLLMFLAEMKRH